jgi:hypothetical protein
MASLPIGRAWRKTTGCGENTQDTRDAELLELRLERFEISAQLVALQPLIHNHGSQAYTHGRQEASNMNECVSSRSKHSTSTNVPAVVIALKHVF